MMKKSGVRSKELGVFLLTIYYLLLTIPAYGAITESNSPSQRASYIGVTTEDTAALAFPLNVTTGCMLLVGGAVYDGAGAPGTIAVTSSRATFSVLVADHPSTDTSYFIAYGIATSSGGDTVNVNPFHDTGYISFAIDEFCGTAAAPLDVDGGTSTGTGTAVADDITTGVADTLVVGVMTHRSSSTTITEGKNWTLIGENEDNGCCQVFSLVFGIESGAPNTYTVDWTAGGDVNWAAMTASFAPYSAPAVTVRHKAIIIQ